MSGAESLPNSRSYHIASHGIFWFSGIWSKVVHYWESLLIALELARTAHRAFLFLDWARFPWEQSIAWAQFRSVLSSFSRL